MRHPFFSVIIPAYNSQKTILVCIDSVLSQDFDDYEVIVVDDGSKDSTAKIVKSIDDRRVTYVHKKNGGASSARNLGIKKASGDWIIFLDSDDTVLAHSLGALQKAILANNADFIITPLESVTPQRISRQLRLGESLTISRNSAIDALIFNLPNANFFVARCPGGKVVRRKLIEDNHLLFDERLKIFEDGVFNIFASYYSKRIMYYNFPFYNYNRHNPGSQSNTFYLGIAVDNEIVYSTIASLLSSTRLDSASFPYLCLELFHGSAFAESAKPTKTISKLQAIKKFEKLYANSFRGKIRLKNAYKTLRIVYILARIRAYRALLVFYKILFLSLKRKGRV